MLKKLKLKNTNEKAITLIALIITIIVLIILAGVTIVTLTGDNGLLKSANNAKENTEIADVKEKIQLIVQDYYIEKNLGKIENIKKYFQKQVSTGELSRVVDNKNETYKVEKDGYEIVLDKNGKIQSIDKKKKVTNTEVWYKLDEITLHLSSINLGEYIKHDESLTQPEWAGDKNITKVVFENEIVPSNTQWWFYSCSSLAEIENLEYLNTCNVISMQGMFMDCGSLVSLDLSSFDTGNVTNMSFMFGIDSLTTMNIQNIDLSSFNTSKVTEMQGMFNQCSKLIDLDLSNFDTRNVTDMSMMFLGCKSLSKLDLTSFYTHNVTKNTFMIGKNVTCPIYIGTNFTLTEADTGYTGIFQIIK